MASRLLYVLHFTPPQNGTFVPFLRARGRGKERGESRKGLLPMNLPSKESLLSSPLLHKRVEEREIAEICKKIRCAVAAFSGSFFAGRGGNVEAVMH
jgi:hypothetical protein